jgi:hypothetical protein
MSKVHLIPVSTYISYEQIERKIYQIRGRKVMIDSDLAKLYGVATKQLNRQVQRNLERFPADFMFQLTREESLRCQIGTLDGNRRGSHRKYLPYVFTQEGVAMLSGILKSPKAVHANVQIMRTFIRLRELLLTHKDLQQKIDEMEKKYDRQFQVVFEALRKLLDPPISPNKRPIGFHA